MTTFAPGRTTDGNGPLLRNQQSGFGSVHIYHVSDPVVGNVDPIDGVRELPDQADSHVPDRHVEQHWDRSGSAVACGQPTARCFAISSLLTKRPTNARAV